MNLRRYDIYIVHYDDDAFIEEDENINGQHTNANDALNIITVQKNRIEALQAENERLRGLIETLWQIIDDISKTGGQGI